MVVSNTVYCDCCCYRGHWKTAGLQIRLNQHEQRQTLSEIEVSVYSHVRYHNCTFPSNMKTWQKSPDPPAVVNSTNQISTTYYHLCLLNWTLDTVHITVVKHFTHLLNRLGHKKSLPSMSWASEVASQTSSLPSDLKESGYSFGRNAVLVQVVSSEKVITLL